MILNNPKWETNQITSTIKSDVLKLWLFAVFWNAFIAFAIYAGGKELLNTFDRDPISYIFLSFPVIGVYLFYQATKDTLAWRQYGKTPLVLDTFPGQLGGLVSGYIDIPVDYDLSHQVRVLLTCSRHYTDNSGSDSESAIEVMWQDTIMVDTKASIDGSRVRFSFKPPIHLPESKLKGDESFEWSVNIKLPLTDVATKFVRQRNKKVIKNQEFRRKYIIPVLKTTVDKIQAAQAVSATINRSSKAYYPNTSTPEISPIVGGNQYFFPTHHDKVAGIFLAGFGVGLVVFSWFVLGGMADFIPVTSAIISAVVVLIALALVFLGVFIIINHNLTLEVTPQGINARFGIFGLSFKVKTNIDDIADIVIKKGMAIGNGEITQVWYDLNMVHANGAITTIGSNLEGSSYATSIRQKIITDLGSSWSVNANLKPQSDNHFDLIQSKLRSFQKLLPLVKGLQKLTPFILPAALLYDGREFIFTILSRF